MGSPASGAFLCPKRGGAMICITVSATQVIVRGHAGYAEVGKDIVCAGVSALVQTLVRAAEDLTADDVATTVQTGFVLMKYHCPSEKLQILLELFCIGVGMIAERYPDHVTIQRPGVDGVKSYGTGQAWNP